ncbi:MULTISPECIES: glutamine--fructose-6-phosphate transaminase (isomerizing) [unclassified Clostridioides]|uniref:glutamine--fructose-6-phosphate transaminase (isomerizing) n=1 Tax=unclassified Clostridioides TaxID=2635829 RepID=UPI001D0F86D5|nr:glutamine--fructose-6-phosphate transaminase (isomerizing) [Clostridioides sp. ZZV14-6150]MCC0661164.1 glutamine--fructose-6-phosphate transaminase (isomerizing) [Clostridioides sp. ZZV14-6154]MCC0668118.1 glutamine--fructose-6-phosphate transaminase (isomerizing) [Clostridioides sp. ZZV14-6153]MCC0717997.1 glutamine--fructose-6-phosphate transaminase (isomerizing) [Clostridioides sp. ZZV14-6105]MCC0722411.1 glutamine--fructose-6-phosphate transaminase (isomerizing) [Clostridioides sp. ZZV14
MCGIVGYLGSRKAAEVIVEGLSKLEYRGYDSAGVAVNGSNCDELNIRKFKGRLSVLAEDLEKNPIDGNLGIGHTRWATHGEPSDVNSHPHFNQAKTIAVVHNGIIENYMEIKEELISEGVKFESQTDTEVIAHLVDKYYEGNLLDAVYKTISKLRGAYALGVICKDHGNELVAVRKDSPLVVGVGEGENFIASDIPALLKYTRDVYFLDNGEIVHLKDENVTIYDSNRNLVEKEVFHVTWDVEAASKGGYDYFMSKEIHEQPTGVRETLERRLDDNGNIILDSINISKEDLDKINKVYIVACGTAYNAGLLGKYAIEKFVNIPVITDIASEFRYSDPFVDENSLVILVSQSGETADTLAVLRDSKAKGARILSITNVVGSSIARESDDVFYTWAGPEVAVASTKAYTTQITSLYMIALDFAIKKGTITREFYDSMISKMKEIPSKIQEILDNEEYIKEVAKTVVSSDHAFYLGRGIDYSLAMEGSLKLKEISYIHAEAFAAGELKHGTIALIEKGTPVIAIATQEKLFEKMVSNMEEVRARGAYVVAIAQSHNKDVEKAAEKIIYIPNSDDILSPILAVVPMQLLAYHVSVLRGCDVDKPRNLAKSVTVE